MLCDLRQFRSLTGLTQSELAHLSGVSLPTIQNIESAKANPSVEVLQKLLSCFGLELGIELKQLDVALAQVLGVPLFEMGAEVNVPLPSADLLLRESKKWSLLLAKQLLDVRGEEAIIAFILAVKTHYPKFYKEKISTSVFEQKLATSIHDGRIIKLRRIALAKLGGYL